jgi:hypothetical protein
MKAIIVSTSASIRERFTIGCFENMGPTFGQMAEGLKC